MRPKRSVIAATALISSLALSGGIAPIPTASASSAPKPNLSTLSGSFSFYSGGDTNVEALWQDDLIPAFNKKYPNIHVKYVFDEHGTDDTTTLARIAEAVKDHRASGYALVESATNAVELGARQNLFIPVTTKAIPNAAKVPPSYMQVVDGDAVPYRGSKVVLAYNTKTVKTPPKTISQLLSWVQAHPGQFAYCEPSGGGSGSYFVQDVLDSYMRQSAVTKLAFTDAKALEKDWAPGLAELHKLNSDMYGNGTYPTGNTQVVSLIASGAVQMATVWSDQGTQAVLDRQFPKSVKLTDINPPFAGSPVYLGVPRYTPENERPLVDAFLNFVLSAQSQSTVVTKLAGFPGISLLSLGGKARSEFSELGSASRESLPYSADVSSDLNRIWQEQVP